MVKMELSWKTKRSGLGLRDRTRSLDVKDASQWRSSGRVLGTPHLHDELRRVRGTSGCQPHPDPRQAGKDGWK